jgi:hypothetical protein
VRLEEYGVFENDCVAVTNAIRAHHPRAVIFLACAPKISNAIREHLPPVEIIVLNEFDKIRLRSLPGFRKNPITVDISYLQPPRDGHVITMEKEQPMSLVIGTNLATAVGAELYLLPRVTDEEVESTAEQLRSWANDSGLDKENAKQEVLGFIKGRLGPLQTARPDSVSFITSGIPYGLYPFRCPTTHFLSYPLLGVGVLNGMVKSLNNARRSPAVVFIDPHAVDQNEIASLKTSFGRAGYILRSAVGENATAGEARDLTELLPSDFIFYSTHCGELSGRRIAEKFIDERGQSHIIAYDLVRTLSLSATPGMITVQTFFRFLSLDGVPWTDDEGKRRIGASEILKTFIKLEKDRGGDPKRYSIVESIQSPPIKSSDSLKMHDFNYCPMPRVVGGYMHPVVFNNACSSWRELASRYVGGGASVYIGTSLDVVDSLAKEVASTFGREVYKGRPVGYALFRAQKPFIKQLDYSPYLMNGYLFTTLLPLHRSAPPARLIVAKRIIESLEVYERNKSTDENATRELESTKAFLRKELRALTAT